MKKVILIFIGVFVFALLIAKIVKDKHNEVCYKEGIENLDKIYHRYPTRYLQEINLLELNTSNDCLDKWFSIEGEKTNRIISLQQRYSLLEKEAEGKLDLKTRAEYAEKEIQILEEAAFKEELLWMTKKLLEKHGKHK